MSCPLCSGLERELFLEKGALAYLRCVGCDFVFTDTSTFDYEAHNEEGNESMFDTHTSKHSKPKFQRRYTKLLGSFTPYRKTGRLLEIGCSTGAFIGRGRELGWEVTGVEPVSESAQFGIDNFDLDIRIGTLEEAALEDNCFDVAYSNAVLEHLANPLEVVREAYRVLRPGGVIYADTVNIDSYTFRNLGAQWKLVDPRMHLCLFTPVTLRELMQRAGLEVLKLSSHGVRFRPNSAPRLTGIAHVLEELKKGPYSFATRINLQGDSIAVLARKPETH